MTITELPPRPDSILGSIYESPDYMDRFAADIDPTRFRTVDDVAVAWFTEQPSLIRMMSTNTFSKDRISKDLADGGLQPGSTVGSWEIIDRNDHEIVFGDDMGFMQYRCSFRLDPAAEVIEAANTVKYLWPRAGRFYFRLVRPMHQRFMRLLLAKTAGSQATE